MLISDLPKSVYFHEGLEQVKTNILIFIQIFNSKRFLVLWYNALEKLLLNGGVCMAAERAVMQIRKVTNLGRFCYLNSHCIRKSIIYCLWVLREMNSCFRNKTQKLKMLLPVSGRYVGAHPDGHHHGVFIQSSLNLGEPFLRIYGT